MTFAYVGLGANIGEPHRQIEAAIEELRKLSAPGSFLVSHLYRSAPLGGPPQPDFLNAVARIDTSLSPEALLGELQAIEDRHGRERPFANAPRTLDLDLLLHGDRRLDGAGLTLPHPRMHERAFVLQPLLELDAEISIPEKGKAAALLSACGPQRVERMPRG
ncbi:MAG: 2-amino-4-hydroxy-6-hydroxymethyldihydropteridine diphosphokinase [Burkholderiales bacterium]|nr:2-amino-4-hydroxy-6-hydroxymethyldihydropteridine diphosphokinase [Burkholderiales bacterium]